MLLDQLKIQKQEELLSQQQQQLKTQHDQMVQMKAYNERLEKELKAREEAAANTDRSMGLNTLFNQQM